MPKRLLAAAVASTIAFSAVTAVPNALPIAYAASSDVMPGKYYVKMADDGAAYVDQMNRFLAVSMLRHVYHSASTDQKYEDYYGDKAKANYTIAAHSEAACFMAKARLSVAILQVEGNAAARAIDIERVGIYAEETKAALDLLAVETPKANTASYNAPSGGEGDKVRARSRLFDDALDRLKSRVEEFKDPNFVSYEVNPYAVINFGVERKFVEQALKDNPINDAADDLTVSRVDPSKPADFKPNSVISDGMSNLQTLWDYYGTPAPAPQPQDTPAPEPKPEPEPTSSETKTPEPKPEPTTPTSEPKPEPSTAQPKPVVETVTVTQNPEPNRGAGKTITSTRSTTITEKPDAPKPNSDLSAEDSIFRKLLALLAVSGIAALIVGWLHNIGVLR